MSDEPGSSPARIEVAMLDAAWDACLPGAEALVSRVAEETMKHVGGANRPEVDMELSLVLTDDNRMRVINRRHRGQDKPTNVLSFPSVNWPLGPAVFDPAAAPGFGRVPLLLGDVVISRETTIAEASAQDKSLGDHLAHLVVHGVLHLLGYEHDTPGAAEKMEALEVAILENLGVADPYQSAPRAPAANLP